MKNVRWSPENNNHAPAEGTRDGRLFLEIEKGGEQGYLLVA